MREVVVSAVGVDRPGIVAALTEGLLTVGGNLSDCRAALLRGSFAIVVAASVPDEVSDAAVSDALAPAAEALGLSVWVGPAAPLAPGPPRERAVVSVYGADHPGILSAVARALAEAGANIVDLSSRIVGDPPLYVVAVEVELAPGSGPAELEGALGSVRRAQAVEVAVSPLADAEAM